MQDKIQEIMFLVDAYRDTDKKCGSYTYNATTADARALLESKLRELVREPLQVQYPEGYENPFARVAYDAGWHAAERAHNLTNTSGVE